MNEIVKIKIADIGHTVTGKTPSSNNPEDFGSEFMFVTPSDSFDSKMMKTTERYLSEEGVAKLSNKLLPPKSIMITCIGSAMGKTSMNKTSCVTNQQINSVVPSEKYFQDYIYYAIRNNYKLLRNASTGSTALPLLNKTDFDLLELPLHTNKDTQQKIASVLSALDSKIELNNRINAELEAMAKTIYDYWFVQFDFPYDFAQGRPDKNGKPYKSSGGKMVWNEELKREVPEGWEAIELRNYITSNRGVSYSGVDIEGEGIPMINLNSFNTDSTYKHKGLKSFAGTFKEVKVLKPFDLVMCNTQQTALDPAKDIIGKTFLIPDIFSLGAISSHHVTTINFKNDDLKFYFNSLFNSDYFHRYISGYATGTNILSLNFDGVMSYRTELPNSELLTLYKSIVLSYEKRKSLIIMENEMLSSLRDWLLPMLMNGQVRVR